MRLAKGAGTAHESGYLRGKFEHLTPLPDKTLVRAALSDAASATYFFMYRTHTCGELRLANAGQTVTLAGWVQSKRPFGNLVFLDLRDRYGITQVVVDPDSGAEFQSLAESLGREFVVQVSGQVRERESKNPQRATGEVEVFAKALTVLNAAKTPPFTIETDTDGGEDIRMRYRYLDLRRTPLQEAILFRSRMAQAVRNHLSEEGFVEVETPVLIKSTPEGARDFVVPSRMNPGNFTLCPRAPRRLSSC